MAAVNCPTQLVDAVRRFPPTAAVVLGSGFGGIADQVEPVLAVPFAACPPMEPTSVAGHEGRIVLARWNGLAVLLFVGRNHLYEGHSRDTVVAPVRLVARLGIAALILTNAAGGIRDDLTPGTLLIVERHLDWTQRGSWRMPPDSTPYEPPLADLLRQSAAQTKIAITSGTYAAVCGPCYETPAEIRALRSLGADAVGMSTVPEATEAAALGLRCLAVSCITNRAAGLSGHPLSHAEVLAESQRQQARLGLLLATFLARLEGVTPRS